MAAILADAEPSLLIADREYAEIAALAVAGSSKPCRIVLHDSLDGSANTEWKTLEVEQAVAKLSGVQLCAVVGLPDAKWGERVVAVVVKEPTVAMSQDAVISHCRGLIAGYELPKQMQFVDALPMTPSGRVMKRALREQLLAGG